MIDHFFHNLKCAAKLNLAFGVILKIIEYSGFRSFYAHENNICWIDSSLCAPKTTGKRLRIFSTKLASSSRELEKKGLQKEILQVNQHSSSCCFAQRRIYGLQGRRFIRSIVEKSQSTFLFEENTRQPYKDNPCLFRALALPFHGN